MFMRKNALGREAQFSDEGLITLLSAEAFVYMFFSAGSGYSDQLYTCHDVDHATFGRFLRATKKRRISGTSFPLTGHLVEALFS